MSSFFRYLTFLFSLLLYSSHVCGQEAEGYSHFLFLSDQRIITLETVDSESVILNYINLAGSYDVLLAREIVLLDKNQQTYRGHLFLLDEASGSENPFRVKYLIKPGEFLGYVVAGRFDFKSAVNRALLKIGGRIIEFEPVSPQNFELVASRIGELSLSAGDKKVAIQRAGFTRGFGSLYFSGSPEAEEVDLLFKDESVIPPVPMRTPKPRLPSSEAHRPDPVVVRVGATVSRSGGLRGIRVVESVNEKLDQIALETVRNSWSFLPAISDNELAEAEIKLNVVFQR